MSDIMGYGCTAAINLISNMEDRKIIFTESEHGLCEFWQYDKPTLEAIT